MLPEDGIFSELLEPLNAMDDSMLPGAIDALCDSLLFSDMPLLDNDFECILMDPWRSLSSNEGSFDFDDNSVLIRDCMWTSNTGEKDALSTKVKTEPGSDSILGLPIDVSILAGPSQKECYVRNCAPYSIDNDHCYFIHKDGPPENTESETDKETKEVPQELKDSDSSDSETSGDEVDIETVREDKHGLCSIKLQRTLRSSNQWSCRRPTPPHKTRGRSRHLDTAAVKAKLVQAKQMQMSGKCITRTNRRRRPANSLNTSSGNSSDTEEPVKRRMHNSMERLRRQQQRSALHSLREQIPELRNDYKAPKVKILEVGTEYIKQISRVNTGLAERKRRLLERNKELQKKLEMLKRHG